MIWMPRFLNKKKTLILTNSLVYCFFLFFVGQTSSSPVIGRQFNFVRRFEISQKSCSGVVGRGKKAPGACMFNFQCHQEGGKVIGTCIDGFLFGACCSLPPDVLEKMLKKVETSSSSHQTSVEDLQNIKKSDTLIVDYNKIASLNSTESFIDLVTTQSSSSAVANSMKKSSMMRDTTDLKTLNTSDGKINGTSQSTKLPSTPISFRKDTDKNITVGHYNTTTELYPNILSTDVMDKIISNLLVTTDSTTRELSTEKISSSPHMINVDGEWIIIASSTDEKENNKILLKNSETPNSVENKNTVKTETSTTEPTIKVNSFITTQNIIGNDTNQEKTNSITPNSLKIENRTSTSMLISTSTSSSLLSQPQTTTELISTPSTTTTTLTTTSEISTLSTSTAATPKETPELLETTSKKTPSSSAFPQTTNVSKPSLLIPLKPDKNELSYNISSETQFAESSTTKSPTSIANELSTEKIKYIFESPQSNEIRPQSQVTSSIDHSNLELTTISKTESLSETNLNLTSSLEILAEILGSSTTTTQSPAVTIPTSAFPQLIKTPSSSKPIVNIPSNILTSPDLTDPLAIWTTRKPVSQDIKTSSKQEVSSSSISTNSMFSTEPTIFISNDTNKTKSEVFPQISDNHTTTVQHESNSSSGELLFWTTSTTARPQTSPPFPSTNTFLLIQNGTISQTPLVIDAPHNESQELPENTQNIYENVLQQIASNLLKGDQAIKESSTESWGSSTYPIFTLNYDIFNNNQVPILNPNSDKFDYIKIPGLQFEKENSTVSSDSEDGLGVTSTESSFDVETESIMLKNTKQNLQFPVTETDPGVDDNSIAELPSMIPISTLKPPLDINLLMQLLNLTSYIPEAGIFIPPHLLTTTGLPPQSNFFNPFIHSPLNRPRPRPKPRPRPSLPITRRPIVSLPFTTTRFIPSTTTTTTTTTTTRPRPTTTTTTVAPTELTNVRNWRRTCGVRPLVREGRIVNGKRSDFGEWPWQALVRESTWLGIFTKNKCGGVLLNNKYVLTAAHCQPGFLASLIVVLGELDVSGEYEPKRTVQRNVKRVVVHKDFIARTFDNDLALLELESPVDFDEHIIPICMPTDIQESFVGKVGFVSGWGRLSYQGSIPNLLHNVEVPVIPNKECQKWFRESGHSKIIKPEFICAGYKNGKKDSCEGDSGGPLSILGPDGKWVLAGIVSHGIKCAYPNLPGVYMRMTYYKPWIDKVISS